MSRKIEDTLKQFEDQKARQRATEQDQGAQKIDLPLTEAEKKLKEEQEAFARRQAHIQRQEAQEKATQELSKKLAKEMTELRDHALQLRKNWLKLQKKVLNYKAELSTEELEALDEPELTPSEERFREKLNQPHHIDDQIAKHTRTVNNLIRKQQPRGDDIRETKVLDMLDKNHGKQLLYLQNSIITPDEKVLKSLKKKWLKLTQAEQNQAEPNNNEDITQQIEREFENELKEIEEMEKQLAEQKKLNAIKNQQQREKRRDTLREKRRAQLQARRKKIEEELLQIEQDNFTIDIDEDLSDTDDLGEEKINIKVGI